MSKIVNECCDKAGATALTPFNIVRAQSAKFKVSMVLPQSGVQGVIGQSWQKGADLAPGVIKDWLGVDIALMNADSETHVDTARTRAERWIQQGAHCLVEPFDSGAAVNCSLTRVSARGNSGCSLYYYSRIHVKKIPPWRKDTLAHRDSPRLA